MLGILMISAVIDGTKKVVPRGAQIGIFALVKRRGNYDH